MNINTQILFRQPKGQHLVDAPCPEAVDPGTVTLYPLRGEDRSLVIEKCLPKKSLLQLVGNHSGERIACLNGMVWITQSGNLEDFLISSGEIFTITQKGTILIEGLEETRLAVSADK